MTMINKLSFKDVIDLQNKIKEIEEECNTLADAAQQYMSILYDEMEESVILSRLFVTIPFKDLPKQNKDFVMALAHSSGVSEQIKEQTMVLTLLGSRGARPEWNDRRKSKGPWGYLSHPGISLIRYQ